MPEAPLEKPRLLARILVRMHQQGQATERRSGAWKMGEFGMGILMGFWMGILDGIRISAAH